MEAGAEKLIDRGGENYQHDYILVTNGKKNEPQSRKRVPAPYMKITCVGK